MNAINKTRIVAGENLVDTYKWRRFLFGLIKFKEVIKTDSIDTDLFIETDRKIGGIYLNGKIIVPKSSKK